MLYVNGEYKESVYATSSSCKPSWFSTEATLCVGGDRRTKDGYNVQYFKGEIKNVAIYSNIRTTPGEVISSTDDGLMVGYDLTAKNLHTDLSTNANTLKFNSIYGEDFSKDDPIQYINKPLTEMPRTYEALLYAPTDIKRTGVIIGNYEKDGSEKNCLNFELHDYGAPSLYIRKDDETLSKPKFTLSDARREGWVHVVIVHDETEYRCYIDGELTETVTETYSYDINKVQADNELSLGKDTREDKVFKGLIRHVALYNEVLTEEEIKSAYENGVDAEKESLMLYYDLNNRGSQDTIVIDKSSNGNHASPEYYEREEQKDYAYSFAVVGDTQKMVWKDWETATNSTAGDETSYAANVYKWLVDNKDKKNIQWVFGVGDITENNGRPSNSSMLEWEIAKAAITQLDAAGMNYSVILGNHDYRGDTTTAPFNQYFADPNDDFYTKRVSGYYEEGKLNNYYMNFEVAGVKYMMLGLEYGPTDSVLEWASQVVEANPERRVIVTTHAYMFRDGTTLDANDVVPPNKTGEITDASSKNNGDMMWDKFVSQHRNILMVLSGHDPYSNIAFRQDRGVNGNLVSQFLVDPQSMDVSLGMVCMLYFSEDGKDVSVEWISTGKTKEAQETNPDAGDVLHKAINQFEFNMYDNYQNFVHSYETVVDQNDLTKVVHRIYYTNGTCSEIVLSNGENGTSVTVTGIEKTGTNGLVDTYTITFSNGQTANFSVTNGEQGIQGPQGVQGPAGQNGTDGQDGENGAKGDTGPAGSQGVDGKDGTNGTNGKDGKNGKDATTTPVFITTAVAATALAANIVMVAFCIISSKKKVI